MEKKLNETEEEYRARINKEATGATITGKAAEGGLPHGPPPGMYDAHETDVLNAKAEDQLRVLRDRNKQKGEDSKNA